MLWGVEVGRQRSDCAPVRIGLATRIARRGEELYGAPAGSAELVRVELDFPAADQHERDLDRYGLTGGKPGLEPGQERPLGRNLHAPRIRLDMSGAWHRTCLEGSCRKLGFVAALACYKERGYAER